MVVWIEQRASLGKGNDVIELLGASGATGAVDAVGAADPAVAAVLGEAAAAKHFSERLWNVGPNFPHGRLRRVEG